MSDATLMPAVLYLAGSNFAAAASTLAESAELVGAGLAVAQPAKSAAEIASTLVIPRIFFKENTPKVWGQPQGY
jgi:hypothetical protein